MATSFSNPLGFIFDPTGKTAPTYDELQQRKKIAVAMMARQSKMPRNLGEGLAAIGDAWADRSYYDKVNEQEAASRAYEAGQTRDLPEPPAQPIVPYRPAPQATVTPPTQTALQTIPDNQPQQPRTPLPVDQQQDPNSPIVRMPSAEAVQSWRDSVTGPQVAPPRPQPGPRSEAIPSPTGAANIPPVNVAGLGLGGPPRQPPPFAPTAAVQGAGDVASDAPPNEAVRNNVAQQLAQNVFPPVTGGGAATLPQGYKPPAPTPPPPSPAISAAPPVPQIQRAPPVPEATPPTLLPMINDNIRRLDAIARDPRISDAGRAAVMERIKVEQAQIKAANDQTLTEYNAVRQQALEQKTPEKVYGNESARLGVEEKTRKLLPEGIYELSPEQRRILGPDMPGTKTYVDRWGNPKTIHSPASTNVSVDTAGEKEESKIRGKLAAERENEVIQAANKGGENLSTIARAEALHNKISTGALEPNRTTIAAIGKSLGVSDDFLRGIGLKPEEVGSRQAFQAIVNEMTMGKIGPGGMPANNFSEGDRKFLTQTQISLGDDPEANRIKLAAARKMSELHIERAERWGDFKDDPANKGKSFAEFERIWNKELKSRNEFGELNRRAEDLIKNAQQGPNQAGIPGDLPADTPVGKIVTDGRAAFRRTEGGWERLK